MSDQQGVQAMGGKRILQMLLTSLVVHPRSLASGWRGGHGQVEEPAGCLILAFFARVGFPRKSVPWGLYPDDSVTGARPALSHRTRKDGAPSGIPRTEDGPPALNHFPQKQVSFSDGWPIQARFWLEWGSSTAGRSFLVAPSCFRAVDVNSIPQRP